MIYLITLPVAAEVMISAGDSPVPAEDELRSSIRDVADADEVSDSILAHYNKYGYSAVDVSVDKVGGEWNVELDVLKYEDIWLQGGPERTQEAARKIFEPLSGQWVRRDSLIDLLEEFHANPLHVITPALQLGEGGVDVLLRAEQSRAQRWSARWNDSGADPLSRHRFSLQSEWADLWGGSSLDYVKLTTAPRVEEFYSVQLGSRFFQPGGRELQLSGAYSGAQGKNGLVDDFDAYTWRLGVDRNWKLTSQSGWKRSINAGIHYRLSNNALEFGDARARGEADVIQLKVSGSMRKKKTQANAEVIVSPGGFGDRGSDQGHESLRVGANSEYALIRANVQHEVSLNNGWSTVFRLGGQWASNPVLQADQIALGGANGLRGLEEQFALGDSGVIGGIEIFAPAFDAHEYYKLRMSAFLQGGATWDDVIQQREDAITSGLGLGGVSKNGLSGFFYTGWRLDGAGAEVHSQIEWAF